ncbi:hypothetical protein G9A89_020331 [Geosiphon pyriformis]|nr:hypothetical protein G9A89_020331 [Geosiphon pyriformis]
MSLAHNEDDTISLPDSTTSSNESTWTNISSGTQIDDDAQNDFPPPINEKNKHEKDNDLNHGHGAEDILEEDLRTVLNAFKLEIIPKVCKLIKQQVLPEVLENFKQDLVAEIGIASSSNVDRLDSSFLPPCQPAPQSRVIAPEQFPIKFTALFISFSPTFSLADSNIESSLRGRGICPLFCKIPNSHPIDKTVQLVRNIAVHLWTNEYRACVFLVCSPTDNVCSTRDLIRRIRIFCDCESLCLVVVRPKIFIDSQRWGIREFKKVGANGTIVVQEEILQGILKWCQLTSVPHSQGAQMPAEFLNSFPATVKISDRVWVTAEHYVKAQFHQGNRSIWDRPTNPDGQTPRNRVLLNGLWHKFTQHPKLAHKLLSTTPAQINAYLAQEDEKNEFPFFFDDFGSKQVFRNILLEIRERLVNKFLWCMRDDYGVKSLRKFLDGLEEGLGVDKDLKKLVDDF